jgi:FKBP-type peptidyl-prolyl cis-trans isomerase 2
MIHERIFNRLPFSKGGAGNGRGAKSSFPFHPFVKGFIHLIVPAGLVLCLCGGYCANAHADESESIRQQVLSAMPPNLRAFVKEEPAKVENGDLVELNYTISFEDGSLLSTNIPDVAKNTGLPKVAWYVEPKAFSPEKVVIGEKTAPAGLGEAVIGMAVKEKRKVVLPAQKAYGEWDPKEVMQYPCAKTMPKTVRRSLEEWAKNFTFPPVVGKEIWLNLYFPARVTEVTANEVVLEFQQKEGQTPQSAFGTISISVEDNNVTMTLTPTIGALFGGNGQVGKITESDGKQFTVDFNNPAAGKTVVLDMKVVSITKASALNGMALSWLEDHDKGLKEAALENKPMVLLLYADWCPVCKRLMSESFEDPRVRILNDRFVWVKVNSEKEAKYKELYGQDGYPMIVFLDAKGKVLKKDNSFLDGPAMGRELESVVQ